MILRHLRWRADRRAEVSVTSQAKVCSARFISLLVKLFLLGTGGEAALPLIKQGNFRSCYVAKLQLYIMQLSLYCFLNFSFVFLCSSSLYLEGLCVWCWSPCCLHCEAERPRENEGHHLKQQTTAPSRDCIRSLYYWVRIGWSRYT